MECMDKMKKILIFMVLVVALSSFTYGLTPETNGVIYYNFSDTVDYWGTSNATNNGAASSGIYPLFNTTGGSAADSFLFDGASSYVDTNYNLGGTYSISFWTNLTSTVSLSLLGVRDAGGLNREFQLGTGTNILNLQYYTNTNGDAGLLTADTTGLANSWVHIVITRSGNNAEIFINGLSADTDATSTKNDENLPLVFGKLGSTTIQYYDSEIDEIKIYSDVLNDTEVLNIFNYGLREASANFTITSSQTNTFNATINGTLYQTITGTITTPINPDDAEIVNITIDAENYFSYNYFNYDTSTNIVETSLYQAELKLRAFELLTGTEVLANFTIDGDTKASNETFKLQAGLYNITFSAGDYYNKTEQINITALQNSTESFTDVYNSIITVKAWDNVNSEHINTFSSVLEAGVYSTNYTDNTTNGTITFNAIQGVDYTAYIYAENFAYANETITPDNSTELANITVELFNSVSITIYDQVNNTLINTTNISISFISDDGQETNTTSTGTFYKYNLTAGDYQVKFTASGYEISNYYITVSNFSTQSLNAYMLPTGVDQTIFTFKDRNLETVIPDVSLSIEQIINDEWVLINVLTSDVTGRIVFNYEDQAQYRFSTSNSNYEDKTFTLDPIIFTTYSIWLDKVAEEQTDQDYSRTNIKFTPSEYYNNQNNTFTIYFISPSGEFVEYGYNLTYKNTTISGSGVNAIGEVLTDVLLIENAVSGDRVILNYYYRLSDGDLKEYSMPYTIYNLDAQGTFAHNKDETYGLGLFERALIAVIIVILVSGAAFLFGGLLASGVMGMFVFGYMNYIGFLSAWLTIPSMILIFIITSWGATR